MTIKQIEEIIAKGQFIFFNFQSDPYLMILKLPPNNPKCVVEKMVVNVNLRQPMGRSWGNPFFVQVIIDHDWGTCRSNALFRTFVTAKKKTNYRVNCEWLPGYFSRYLQSLVTLTQYLCPFRTYIRLILPLCANDKIGILLFNGSIFNKVCFTELYSTKQYLSKYYLVKQCSKGNGYT